MSPVLADYIKRAVPTGPRLYWRVVVRGGKSNSVGGVGASEMVWHAASCPLTDCAGCAPSTEL